MEQNMKKGRVKGTVLFTVVSVMMVMVVFLMSTLILTTSAQRRAYYTYYETQAKYAADAALETVKNSVYGSADFFSWMSTNAKNVGSTVDFDVKFEDTTIPISQVDANGTRVVNCTAERIGDEWYWDELNLEFAYRRTWQITATAQVGSGAQAGEAVSSIVIYERVREQKVAPVGNGIWWSLSAGTSQTGGAGVFASTFNSGNDNVSVFGPVFSIGDAPAGRTKYDSEPDSYIQNDGIWAGRVVFTKNLILNTNKYVTLLEPYEGLEIYGNFGSQNNLTVESLQSPLPTQYNQLNYVYVDGMLSFRGGRMSLGANANGQESYTATEAGQRVNLYAGAVTAQKPILVNGDIFLHEETLESSFSDTGLTYLATFIEQNVEKANYNHTGYAGGDLISANTAVRYKSNKGFTVGGDFIMTNEDSELEFGMNEGGTIGGSLICAGKLIMNSDKNITVKGGVYVDPTKVTIYKNMSINNVQFNSSDDAEAIATKLIQACTNSTGAQASYDVTGDSQVTAADTHKNTYDYVVVESLGGMVFQSTAAAGSTAMQQYQSVIENMIDCQQTYTDNDGNSKVVSVGLYPFCSRLDEIFFSYIRWDLAASTMAEAEQKMNNDELIKESKACGHIWAVKEKTDGSTTIWVPYTSSLNTKEHAFIEEIETGDKAMDSYTIAPDLPTELPTGVPSDVLKADTVKKDYEYYYHKADGSEAKDTYNDAIYIGGSVVIDSSQFSSGKFFIDPSAGGYDTANPLVVYLKGSFGGQLDFLVNNTYDHAHDNGDGTKGDYYANLGTFSDREQVVFYFDETFWAQKFFLYSTGSYKALTEDKAIDYVANPYYPGSTEWNTLTGAEKYKFEYIPNVTIYATENKTYELQNDSFLSAFVISPKASISMPAAGNLQVNTSYREHHNSERVNSGDYTGDNKLIAIGGFILNDFWTNNMSYLLYATDGNRPGIISGSEPNQGSSLPDGDWISDSYSTAG